MEMGALLGSTQPGSGLISERCWVEEADAFPEASEAPATVGCEARDSLSQGLHPGSPSLHPPL